MLNLPGEFRNGRAVVQRDDGTLSFVPWGAAEGISFKIRSSIPADHPHWKQSRTEDEDLPHTTQLPEAMLGPQWLGGKGGR